MTLDIRIWDTNWSLFMK